MMNKEVEIDLLANGEVLVSRFDSEYNKELLEVIEEINVENIEELERFLECSDQVEYLLGTEPLCG